MSTSPFLAGLLGVVVPTALILALVYACALTAAGIAAVLMGLDSRRELNAVAWMNAATTPAATLALAVTWVAASPGRASPSLVIAVGGVVLAVPILHALALTWVFGHQPLRAFAFSLGSNVVPIAAALVVFLPRALGAF